VTRSVQHRAVGAGLVPALALAIGLAAAGSAQESPAPPKFYIRPTAWIFEHLYEGEFVEPTSATFDAKAQELWVADTKNSLVGVFTPEGIPLFSFSSNELKEPLKIAVDGTGRVYVIDIDRSKIKVFSYRGQYLGPVAIPGAPAKPSWGAIAIDGDGNLYAGDNETCQVLVVAPDGKPRQRFGECGIEPGQFQAITGIAADKEHVVVTDAQGVAVQLFDRHGELLKSWGKHDMGVQNFSMPQAVALDGRGHVIVIDTLRHEVKFFDFEGNFLDRFGGLGWRAGQVAFPTGITTDGGSRIFVVEKANNRVQAFVEVEGDIGAAP
jgi:DNA-binding beta-propeller fold protein YncE